MLCFVGARKCKTLQEKVKNRLSTAFRPKTRMCYQRLFKVFVGFCLCVNVALHDLSVASVLCFLEYLVDNRVSVCMVVNYISALKAMAIIYSIPHSIFEHPQIKYFVHALKINRPLTVSKKNVIDIPTLKRIIALCQGRLNAVTFKAIFLTGYFGFFRLSNLAPHSVGDFDPTKHFTGGDVFFEKNQVKLLLKWSKTLQMNDQVKLITLHRLNSLSICPYQALKALFHLYSPGNIDPLFQCHTMHGWQVMTDSRVRKTLASINTALDLPRNFFTFHAFRRSGATLAYKAHAPIRDIKEHGTWTPDCVWRYIQSDVDKGSKVANAMKKMLL